MENFLILAIDDQNFNLHFLKHHLNEYRFMGVNSGNEAFVFLELQLPDLILLDVVMPEMDGYAVIRKLKSEERTRNIPVIFVTSLNSVEQEEEGFNLGAVDYIVKPFNPTIVRARIKNTLRLVYQQRLLEKMALIDGLTEVPNRRYFEEVLKKEFYTAIRNQQYFSLIMIDVDNFKDYNDRYGHYRGDEALTLIAKTIKSSLKRPGDFIARYGGEEFAVILPYTDSSGGEKIAEDIRQAVYNANILHLKNSDQPYLSISLGGHSLIPKYDQSAHSIIEKADLSLYKAKHSGRNLVVWDQS